MNLNLRFCKNIIKEMKKSRSDILAQVSQNFLLQIYIIFTLCVSKQNVATFIFFFNFFSHFAIS